LLNQAFGFVHLMRSAETGTLWEAVRETIIAKDFDDDVPAVGSAKFEAVFLLFYKHALRPLCAGFWVGGREADCMIRRDILLPRYLLAT